jgi:hypothetical protein
VYNNYKSVDAMLCSFGYASMQLINNTSMCFTNTNNEKKTSTKISTRPNFFGYMKHPLKPLREVVA